MDHEEAMQMQVMEKYLLGELSAAQVNEFEEHYFDCEECANDLRITSRFIDTTKKVLATDRASEAPPPAKRRTSWLPSAYGIAASIALLGCVLYQNIVTIPQLRNSAAPQALALFSLSGVGTRSAAATVITPTPGKPLGLLLDIPPHDNIAEYRCQLVNSSGTPVVSINLPEETATKTVSLFVPASVLKPGPYQLAIAGRPKDGATFTELEKYPLQVN
jgi:hypothetical protein